MGQPEPAGRVGSASAFVGHHQGAHLIKSARWMSNRSLLPLTKGDFKGGGVHGETTAGKTVADTEEADRGVVAATTTAVQADAKLQVPPYVPYVWWCIVVCSCRFLYKALGWVNINGV